MHVDCCSTCRISTQTYGDSAVLVTVYGETEDESSMMVQEIADTFASERVSGVTSTIAAYDTVLIEFDCTVTTGQEILGRLDAGVTTGRGRRGRESRTFAVPVVYGGEFGPDLAELSVELGVSESDIVEAHLAGEHVIRCVGSPQGAPMTELWTLPRAVPRRAVPRAAVPAGSVAVAGRQATIYAASSPGGWRLIGRTPLRLFDPEARPPVRHMVGDRLRFVRVDPEEFGERVGELIETFE